MLKVEHIMVNYGDFQAISDVSLDMKEGEIVALLGGQKETFPERKVSSCGPV